MQTSIKLWNLDGSLIKTLTGHQDSVKKVSFSSDGKMIASASLDNTVKLWQSNGTLEGHTDSVWGVSFSPDWQTLAAGSGDNTVTVWDFTLDNLLVRGCNLVRDYLENNPNVNDSDRHLCQGIENSPR